MGTDMEMMEPPKFALDWTVEVTSEADAAVVTANEVVIDVVPSGYEFSCDFAGKPVDEGHGHYHVLIDHSLVDMRAPMRNRHGPSVRQSGAGHDSSDCLAPRRSTCDARVGITTLAVTGVRKGEDATVMASTRTRKSGTMHRRESAT